MGLTCLFFGPRVVTRKFIQESTESGFDRCDLGPPADEPGGQTEEELTVLLAPRPLEGLQIGRTPLALAPEQTAKWEAQWGGKV